MHINLKKKINYDQLYYCSSLSINSKFKKPNAGMLLKSIKEFNIDTRMSYLIGDRWSDIEAGKKVKCKTMGRYNFCSIRSLFNVNWKT